MERKETYATFSMHISTCSSHHYGGTIEVFMYGTLLYLQLGPFHTCKTYTYHVDTLREGGKITVQHGTVNILQWGYMQMHVHVYLPVEKDAYILV